MMIALIQVVSNGTVRIFEAPFVLPHDAKLPKPGNYSVTVKNMSDKPITVQIGSIKAETLAPQNELSREYAIEDYESVQVRVICDSLNWLGIIRPSNGRSLSVNYIYLY